MTYYSRTSQTDSQDYRKLDTFYRASGVKDSAALLILQTLRLPGTTGIL